MVYPVYYLPPDHTDDWEWGLTHRLANDLPRVTTLEGFIGFVLVAGVLLSIILFKLLLLALRRLANIYHARANSNTPGGTVLKWSALGLLLLWALLLLIAGLWPGFSGIAFVIASASLLVYTLLSEWVDYRASKAEPLPVLPDNLSIEDFITFKNEVDAAGVGVPVGA